MVEFIKGNLFDSDADIILATGNSYIKKDRTLAMGAGAAKQLAEKYPKAPETLGHFITHSRSKGHPSLVGYFCHLGFYGWCAYSSLKTNRKSIGVFQTKRHFKDKSSLDLIARSLMELNKHLTGRYANYPKYKGNKTIAVNYPGIGLGGLDKDEVKAVLYQYAPSNLRVYYL